MKCYGEVGEFGRFWEAEFNILVRSAYFAIFDWTFEFLTILENIDRNKGK